MNNIKRILFSLAICIGISGYAQSIDKAQDDKSAINWASGLTWQQVKAKAKKENKYIFVDCFTTWCKPCREMDQKVYTVDSVGSFLNKGFISVKLQMDRTTNDDAATKSWYKTASTFAKDYHIDAYPTLLFFTPSGEIGIKEIGLKDPAAFITTAVNAKDPSKQYYILLKDYKKGKLDDAAKRSLINTAKQLGDTANYYALRASYFAYLHTLPKEKLYTKENIEFIANIISRRSQPVFDMFYPDGSVVDKVMEKNGYAKKVVDDVIMKEKVPPLYNAAVDAKQEPNWNVIFNSIAKDYKEDYADRAVMDAKMRWYYANGDMQKFTVTLNDKMEKYGSDTTDRGQEFILNNLASLIWEKIGAVAAPSKEEVKELARVSNWMEGIVRRGATATGFRLEQWHLYIDTYANLLYKIGRKDEGIKWEEFAIAKCKEIGGDYSYYLEEYEGNLAKMKKGEANWPIREAK